MYSGSYRSTRSAISTALAYRDTLFAYNNSVVGLSPYVAKEYFKSSAYIYVNEDGLLNISLPA